MKEFGLSKSQRLRTSREFSHVYDSGCRAGDQNLLVFATRNTLGETRFGVSVSKKHGNAVRRARKKRLLRETFRLEQRELPAGLDLILIPRPGSRAELDDYRRSLKRTVQKLARRLSEEDAS